MSRTNVRHLSSGGAGRSSRHGTTEPAGEDLRRYGRVLRRHLVLVLSCVVVAVTGAGVLTALQSPRYDATATLLLGTSATEQVVEPGSSSSGVAQRLVENEIQVLQSAAVAQAVTEQTGHPPTITASSGGSNDTIEVTATAGDAQTAAADANAVAEAYVANRRDRAVQDLLQTGLEVEAKIDAIDARLAAIETDVASLDTQIAAAGSDEERAALEAQRRSLVARTDVERENLADQRGTYVDQQDRLQAASTVSMRGGPEVLTPAVAPASPASPDPVRNLAVAGLLGLLVGIALAFVRDNVDDTLRTKADVERAVADLAVLGLIPGDEHPERHGGRSGIEDRLVRIADPHSAEAESIRMVRTAIQFLEVGGHPVRTLQVTSAEPADGKTTTAANLAASFASAGMRVVAVCCDWRQPRLHDSFDLDNRIGFTSVLVGDVPLNEAVRRVAAQPNLLVLPAGPAPPNPAELLASRRTADVLDALRADADLVIVDTPPVLAVSDAMVLAPSMDGVLLVARAGKTAASGLARTVELLDRVDAPLLGVVVVDADRRESYGGLYGDYGYAGYVRRTDDGSSEATVRRASRRGRGTTAADGTRSARSG